MENKPDKKKPTNWRKPMVYVVLAGIGGGGIVGTFIGATGMLGHDTAKNTASQTTKPTEEESSSRSSSVVPRSGASTHKKSKKSDDPVAAVVDGVLGQDKAKSKDKDTVGDKVSDVLSKIGVNGDVNKVLAAVNDDEGKTTLKEAEKVASNPNLSELLDNKANKDQTTKDHGIVPGTVVPTKHDDSNSEKVLENPTTETPLTDKPVTPVEPVQPGVTGDGKGTEPITPPTQPNTGGTVTPPTGSGTGSTAETGDTGVTTPTNPSDPVTTPDPKPHVNKAPILNVPVSTAISVGDSGFDPRAGVTAMDLEDGDLSHYVTVRGTVDPNQAGTYTLTYQVLDSQGAGTTATRQVVVQNDPPQISVPATQTINIGQAFSPLTGVSASDKQDGDLTGNIQVTGTVNTSTPGSYQIMYSVKDSTGATATATTTVNVVASDSVFTGLSDLTVQQGQAVDLQQGVSVIDPSDASNHTFQASGVDTSKPGEQVVTYTHTDKFGHVTTATRRVIVVATTQPEQPTEPTDGSQKPQQPAETEKGNSQTPQQPTTPVDSSQTPEQPTASSEGNSETAPSGADAGTQSQVTTPAETPATQQPAKPSETETMPANAATQTNPQAATPAETVQSPQQPATPVQPAASSK